MTSDDCLEHLELERRAPDRRFLSDLFEAFNRRILFESASKIVRNRAVEVLEKKPAGPDVFWSRVRDQGAGGTCFPRVSAFEWLTRELGFSPRKILGSIVSPRNHAALIFQVGSEQILADVGYPLPVLLPLSGASFESILGDFTLSAAGRRVTLRFTGGPDAGRIIDFDLADVSEPDFGEAWRETFATPSFFLKNVVLNRMDGHRVLRFFRGEIEILDAHTRTRIPLLGSRAERLAAIFEIDAGLIREALELTGDPESETGSTIVEAFLPTDDAGALLNTLSTAEGYRHFVESLGPVQVDSQSDGIIRVRIGEAGGRLVEETITPRLAEGRIDILRSEGLKKTGFRIECVNGVTRLVRFAELPDAREEFFRVDAGRGRIAGLLAMELLALSRRLED